MKPKTLLRIIETVFLLTGVGCAVGAVVSVAQGMGFVKAADRFPGVVVDNEEYQGSKGPVYNSVVEYGGKGWDRKRFVSRVGSNPPAYQVGDAVTILVSKDGRTRKLDGFMELWFTALILGIFGAAFGTPAAVMMVLRIRQGNFAKYVKEAGESVETGDFKIRINGSLSVNNRNPFYLECKAVIDGETRVCKSASIWEDPSEKVEGLKIRIYYLRNRPEKYLVDIGFLEDGGA